MSCINLGEAPSWYVIHTRPKQERRACLNLMAWKVESFNPELRERRFNQYTSRPTYTAKSLFPNYIFVRFSASKMLRNVMCTRGVRCVLRSNGVPVSVDAELVELIQSRMDDSGFVSMGEHFKAGDKVVITSGPLRSLHGVFAFEMKDTERVRILLDTVTYQAHILASRDQLQKVI
jgi:transcriptional antiterminator RfaH